MPPLTEDDSRAYSDEHQKSLDSKALEHFEHSELSPQQELDLHKEREDTLDTEKELERELER